MRWHDLRHAELLARLPWLSGDRLYVREAWRVPDYCDPTPPRDLQRGMSRLQYEADQYREPRRGEWTAGKFRQGMHMPRWASRLTLTVSDVRVERLQDINDDDAEAEGCPPCEDCHGVGWINSGPDGGWQCTAPFCGDAYRDQYARLWDEINGPGSWEANPWVAAYTFTVQHSNIDQMGGK